ncbi:potassium uptake TrkH family protein [Serinibacter salmoneus]|uniref:Potassium uptake TrkH family protein n=1 Tax=Serinibacter salmoneus TaxID=556530 RepID=A0A2A9D474_9MICO|nr:potassium uptake TrkH family protein [Serinibacter salmoneus]
MVSALLGAVVIGTGLLLLPAASVQPGGVSFLDGLFTAVSAVCVTGLVVLPPSAWTPFGQGVILALIQIGGLGVMTLASVIGLTVLRRMSLRSTLRASAEHPSPLRDMRLLVKGVVLISLAVEAGIALPLVARFALGYDMPFASALWHGVFTAVSSFNNAGFALHPASLMTYVGDPLIILPVCVAIIVGGLGFPVILQLRRHLAPRLWSMNTRLVLVGTAVLLVAGTVVIALLEWDNPATLGALATEDRVLAAFTQSVQTRTAGFNSVDIAAMDTATWLVMDVLMFIGGGPAGTAGGIKITTFAVLFFIILTEVRGERAVNIFGKRLSRAVHRQAISVALLAMALVVTSTVALMWMTDFTLDQILFEVISAFATVGLSTGITADLPVAAEVILILLMVIGRLGPITFASALALRERTRQYEFPKERPIIG